MKSRTRLIWPLAVVLALLLLPGCLPQGQVMEDEQPVTPAADGRYYDFEDVKIPAGLELNRDGSFIYESERLKAGLLGFKTQGSVTELVNYFQKNMLKDGWSLLSSFKYNKNILIYTKPDKVCLISVALPTNVEGARVEVWVAPLQSQSASQKTMRPFFKKKSPAGGQAAPAPRKKH